MTGQSDSKREGILQKEMYDPTGPRPAETSQQEQKSFWQYFYWTCGTVVAAVAQNVGLPIFISTLGDVNDAFFVLFFCALSFVILFFSTLAFLHATTNEITYDRTNFPHLKLFMVGFFNALNGILIVYASPPQRTSPALQAILPNALVPFTVFFSKVILKKVYSTKSLIGACVVGLGIIISLIPVFTNMDGLGSSVIWPLIFTFGVVPGAAMNVLEEAAFSDMKSLHVVFLLAWTSFYQLISMAFLFWVDLLPGFGSSSNFNDFWNNLSYGFSCFFNTTDRVVVDADCSSAGWKGMIFIMAYVGTYYYGGLLMKYASANFQVFAQMCVTPLSVLFWFFFPSLNTGDPITGLMILCDSIAVVVMVAGLVYYRFSEMEARNVANSAQYDALPENATVLL
eukprot:gnl/Hemi2/17159_TR5709_c0_g1_i1.p1 gnl/Hemi2/17159_TR5709_c0_g1~~gnl/Hemi2/17159_TR5709_c0_g1_i1.p1  ORF type:complete len:417 (-),score=128.75 gnl/Hemi2/17159_TR5709_c0_g1_i1:105-1295(-)